MPVDDTPIRPADLAPVFAPCLARREGRPIALAVSGGSDSTALMVLFADWLRQAGADPAVHTVLTVDHRLRPESAGEVREVAGRAAALGFSHEALVWEGEKPRSGLQAAARRARYRLMCDYLRAHAIDMLLTAHTRDDQAETLLMRLARGSGLDGLGAMAPWLELGPGAGTGAVQIARPLLGVAKARLRATLEERGIPWIEDPSNQSLAFERTRWRAARGNLEALGLSGEMLALSARRLQRARTALEAVTDQYCAEGAGMVHTDRCGLFRIDREKLRRAPEEIALRVIGRCIAAAGGSGEAVPLAKLESMVAKLWSGKACNATGSRTLARAQITATGDVVQVEREPGRQALPVLTVAAGAKALWDGRFRIAIADGFEGSLDVRPLGGSGLAVLKRAGIAVKGTSALRLVASFWRENELLAVPAIDFWARQDLEGRISADFAGFAYNSGADGGIPTDDLDTC